jgi:hypothetical protein
MTDFENEEFWKARGRLYDSTNNIRIATEKLAEIATAHEKRLDYSEQINKLKRPSRPEERRPPHRARRLPAQGE